MKTDHEWCMQCEKTASTHALLWTLQFLFRIKMRCDTDYRKCITYRKDPSLNVGRVVALPRAVLIQSIGRCGVRRVIFPDKMSPAIRVTSPSDQDIVTYPLVIVRGTTTSPHPFIYISAAAPSPQRSIAFPISEFHFTAVYHLSPGVNTIRLSAHSSLSHPVSLNIHYQPPPPQPPYVRLVYLLTSDADGSFQSPDALQTACNAAAGVARLQTAGLMIQSATAEMMHAHGLQRRTFRLAPSVHIHRCSNLTTERAHSMDGMSLWTTIADELAQTARRNDIIDLVVMSFSRQINGEVKAHTALGGGSLALFGGASLFTWPQNVWQIPKRFLDSRKFDNKAFFDDSAGRASKMGRRACASTTIGALLHELGHCLSLPHPCAEANRHGGGIMNRGFDHFDRLFVQPPSANPLPFWDRGSALRLKHHRFLQFPGEPEMRRMRSLVVTPTPTPNPVSDGPPSFERVDDVVICRSSVGLGHLAYYRNGDNASHEDFTNAEPMQFRLPPLSDLRRKCHAKTTDKILLSVIDIEGRIAETLYEDV